MFRPFRSVVPLLIVVGGALAMTARVAALEKEELVAPITIVPGARTWRDNLKDHVAWCERVWIKPFEARSRNQPRLADALSFARAACEYLIPRPDQWAPPELIAQGKALLNDNFTDPLLMYLSAKLSYMVDPQRSQPIFLFEAAARGADSLPGPKALAWHAYRELAQRQGIVPATHPVIRRTLELMKEVMRDGSYKANEDRIFFHDALSGEFSDFNKRYLEEMRWLAGSPLLSEWARLMVEGHQELDRASLDSRTQEASTNLGQHMAKARVAFTKAWQLRPDRPDPAAAMIAVVTNEGGETPTETQRVWFDRATSLQFDLAPAYDCLLESMKPRFGGSYRLMLAFGKACYETDRIDTVVPQYLNIATYDVAISRRGDWRSVYRGDSELSRALVELALKRLNAPTRKTEQWLSKHYLTVNAWLAGDFAVARKARADAPGPMPYMVQEKLMNLGIRNFEEELASTSVNGAEAYNAALRQIVAHDFRGALTTLKEALDTMSGELQSRAQIQVRVLELQTDYDKGAWIAMAPARESTEWFENPPPVNKPPDSVPQPDFPKPPRKPPLLCALSMNRDFECRWQLPKGPARPSDPILVRFFLAVRIPQYEPPFRATRWVTFQIKEKQSTGTATLTLLDFMDKPLEREIPFALKPESNVSLIFAADQVTIQIDGVRLLTEFQLPRRVYNYPEVVIGFDRELDPEVAVRKIEVRRIAVPVTEKPLESASLSRSRPPQG